MVFNGGKRRKCAFAICVGCWSEFMAPVRETERGGGKFCSRNCQRAYQARKNAESRKDGLTRQDRIKRWKESVSDLVIKAHRKTYEAIKQGRLARMPCEICGVAKVDAHHDDYSKPLDVRWLCRSHHLEFHRSTK